MARILVLTPALGTGGGSRWSLQAAESLAARGHEVHWVAGSPRQPAPAWTELGIATFQRHFVRLPWPETVAGGGRAFLATQRMRSLLRWSRRRLPTPDAVLFDNVPFVVGEARSVFPHARVVFYCHFPEALYARTPPWWLRAHRRYWVRRERAGLARADAVLVNSSYTCRHLLGVFPELAARVAICHPAARPPSANAALTPAHLLVVARWSPDKNLPLALAAHADYRRRLLATGHRPLPLCIAGGFDAAWPAAHGTFAALEQQRRQLSLTADDCRLLRNPTDAELDALYRGALALIHPTPNEHFGMIAPEAMLRGIPVIGISGSGLADSVVDGATGFLVASEPSVIAARLEQLHLDPVLRARLSEAARQRVASLFLLEHHGARLERALFPS